MTALHTSPTTIPSPMLPQQSLETSMYTGAAAGRASSHHAWHFHVHRCHTAGGVAPSHSCCTLGGWEHDVDRRIYSTHTACICPFKQLFLMRIPAAALSNWQPTEEPDYRGRLFESKPCSMTGCFHLSDFPLSLDHAVWFTLDWPIDRKVPIVHTKASSTAAAAGFSKSEGPVYYVCNLGHCHCHRHRHRPSFSYSIQKVVHILEVVGIPALPPLLSFVHFGSGWGATSTRCGALVVSAPEAAVWA